MRDSIDTSRWGLGSEGKEESHVDEDGFPIEDWSSFEKFIYLKEKTGSRVIFPAGAKDSDYDWIILTNDIKKLVAFAINDEWFIEGDENVVLKESTGFFSLRRENINLIVTPSRSFFDSFVLATKVAKELKLKTRGERVCLFQAILYNVSKPIEWCERRKHYGRD